MRDKEARERLEECGGFLRNHEAMLRDNMNDHLRTHARIRDIETRQALQDIRLDALEKQSARHRITALEDKLDRALECWKTNYDKLEKQAHTHTVTVSDEVKRVARESNVGNISERFRNFYQQEWIDDPKPERQFFYDMPLPLPGETAKEFMPVLQAWLDANNPR